MAPLQRSKSASQSDQLQIQHFIHQHVLHKIYMTSEFNCDGCNTGGFGVRYRCSGCDFDVHEQCATASHRIFSNLHPHHQLILVNRPGDSQLCNVCKGVTNGLSYTCECQTCQFNVHTLCIQIPVTTGVKSLTGDPCQLPGQQVPTTALGGYNTNIQQPVMINQQQQMQGTPAATVFVGYSGGTSNQPAMVNHHQHQQQGMQMGGYNGGNTSQPVMVNHQQKQGIATTALGGYHGVNNNQTHMINNHLQQPSQQVIPMTAHGGQPLMHNNHHQQQKQGMLTTEFGGYQGVNNNQTPMINHHHPQQQVMPTTGFGGYHGGMNSQPMMVNHHQQHQVMPTPAFNTTQQLMTNHHQQIQQQQGVVIPPTAVGGYNVINNNNNQTVMIHHPPPPPPPPPPQPQQSNGYTKVGKLAANILSTSLIGIPLFNSRN